MAEALPGRLPRGRHGLDREQVETSQRTRIFLGMALAMSEKGYVGTSVADVLKQSGVGRETFYQLFRSKLDCFLNVFDLVGEMLIGRLNDAFEQAEGTPLQRLEHIIGEYLNLLAEQPEMARVFVVEVLAAGPEAIERRSTLQERMVDRMTDVLGTHDDQDRFACQALVAAVGSLVSAPLVAGDVDAIRALGPRTAALARRLFSGPARP